MKLHAGEVVAFKPAADVLRDLVEGELLDVVECLLADDDFGAYPIDAKLLPRGGSQ